MKVLFLSNEQILPLSGGGSVGNFKIVKKLVERGHAVTVATPFYLGPKEAQRIEAEHNIILRPFSPFFIHRSVSLRGPKYMLYALLFTIHLLRLLLTDTYDVLFVRNCLLCFPAVLFRPFVKSMYVVSMTDFISAFLHDRGSYPRPVVMAMLRLEQLMPRFFDQVFVITPEMKRMVVKGGSQPSRVHVSYDGVETRVFHPDAVDGDDVMRIRSEFGHGRKIVLFHGVIVFTNELALRMLLEVIDLVLKRADDIAFMLIGHGSKYDELKGRMESERVRFPGHVPYEGIPKYVAASDVGIIPYERSLNNDIIITLKLLEYLALGLPTVTTDLKSISELFSGYEFVRIARTTEEFAGAVIEMSRLGKSDSAARLMQEHYSWDIVTSGIVASVESKYKDFGGRSAPSK